jgi:hypothetical protein
VVGVQLLVEVHPASSAYLCYHTVQAAPEVVHDVRHVQGSGCVLKLGRRACLCQVIEHRSQPGVDAASAKEELEATLGMELAHPHIVRTLKFATRQRAGAVSCPSACGLPYHSINEAN